jgi:hypothetical protein
VAHVTLDSLEMLARRVRRWIAIEDLLFESLGGWAREFPEPAPRRVFGTWCHRHAWHAELWRERLPTVDGLTTDEDDVEVWIAPLRVALGGVNTSDEAVAALRESVLPALQAAVTEHRDAIDPVLDGPTARTLDLVAADLTAERASLPDWRFSS